MTAHSGLRRTTIETLSITPRPDGKTEIDLRLVADNRRLIDCAAEFIKSGVADMELLQVFSAVMPSEQDTVLGQEASSVSPDVVSLDSRRRVQASVPAHGLDFSDMNAPQTAANHDRAAQLSNAPNLAALRPHELASLVLRKLEQIEMGFRAHDHVVRNSIQHLNFIVEKMRKVVPTLAAASACAVGSHHVCVVVDALMSVSSA